MRDPWHFNRAEHAQLQVLVPVCGTPVEQIYGSYCSNMRAA